jgi:hypothetical protein
MPAAKTRRSPDEMARLGAEAFERYVQPARRPEDEDKFVAIDVDTGEYELDPDDYTAVMRLRARRPRSGSGVSVSLRLTACGRVDDPRRGERPPRSGCPAPRTRAERRRAGR